MEKKIFKKDSKINKNPHIPIVTCDILFLGHIQTELLQTNNAGIAGHAFQYYMTVSDLALTRGQY